jgi:hypothetical protein
LAVADQFLQSPRNLENRRATARVVVGTRPLMVKMAGKRDLLSLELRVRTGYHRSDDFIEARVLAGLDHRMQPHGLPRS